MPSIPSPSFLTVVAALAAAASVPAQLPPPNAPSFVEVAQRVAPGVVTLRAYGRDASAVPTSAAPAVAAAPTPTTKPAPTVPGAPPGWVAPIATSEYPGFRLHAACSGFVVDATGEILTCNHALRLADGALPDLLEIETHDNARLLGEIVGAEPTVNLAIVQATVFPNGHAKTLPVLAWGDSEELRPGEWVLAFGDPAGPERFLAFGAFIAQPNRDCYQDLLSAFYMQVGLVAHPEAYGGPLVNSRGEVVGILAPRQVDFGKWQASARLGIEFGLPSKIVTGLHESIRSVRSFRSPWLGIAVMSRPEIVAARGLAAYEAMPKPRNGILIENVFQPSPAFLAGIEPGDFLVGFDQTRIFTPVDFQKALYLAGIGRQVQLEVFRGGETSTRELLVEQRPEVATPR
jgi:serine protease Do